MNSTVYVFGGLGKGYTQYPDDYAREIFQTFRKRSTANSQIITHRDNDLIYYGYIRKMDGGRHYIGFCVLLNGVMFSNVGALFPIFENAVERLVASGEILGLSDKGDVIAQSVYLSDKEQEVELIASAIKNGISPLENNARKLTAVSYGTANSESKTFSVDDGNDTIVAAAAKYSYVCICKEKDYDTASLTSYRGVVRKLHTKCTKKNEEIKLLQQEKAEIQKELAKVKARQRNFTWVAVLGIVVIVLGVVLWNMVLFPSEVTHKEMGEYVYYGPLKDGKPHGVGVAIYPEDDKDGRKFYYGNFVNGERQDSCAVLFWQDGDYFYGSMSGDKFENGVEYINSDNSYFRGTFVNSDPYDGDWYDFRYRYSLRDGVRR